MNTVLCQDFAERVFNVLVNTSSPVEYLNLSENNVSDVHSCISRAAMFIGDAVDVVYYRFQAAFQS